jgi:microcystin-dependent protein
VSLLLQQIEPHRHKLMAVDLPGAATIAPQPVVLPPGPGATYFLAQNNQAAVNMYHQGPPNVSLSPSSIDSYQGRGQPHENRQPFQVINYIICAEDGIMPTR